MKTKDEIIAQAAEDLIVTLDYHFHNTIFNHYHTVEDFRASINSFWARRQSNNKAMSRYIANFPNIISKLIPTKRDENGKQVRIVEEVMNKISDKYRVVGKVNRGKKGKNEFKHLSYILISNDHIDEVAANENLTYKKDEELKDYFSKSQKKMIRRLFDLSHKKPKIEKTKNEKKPEEKPVEEKPVEETKVETMTVVKENIKDLEYLQNTQRETIKYLLVKVKACEKYDEMLDLCQSVRKHIIAYNGLAESTIAKIENLLVKRTSELEPKIEENDFMELVEGL